MRVFVYPEKTHEELGAERWQVEWHTAPRKWEGMDEGEGPDPDCMISHYSAHATEKAAKAAAKRRIKDDYYGCPVVTRQVVDWYVEEDRIAEWVNVGDEIYVS
jgi:hypothetical protein